MNHPGSENNGIKSTAVVKYSASQSPATFAQLQCNTDLNLPPANWLSNSTSVYGLQHVLFQSTGFSRYVFLQIPILILYNMQGCNDYLYSQLRIIRV